MDGNDLDKELISLKALDQIKNDFSIKDSKILCNHCKRTAKNGVRCLGMCVADNSY